MQKLGSVCRGNGGPIALAKTRLVWKGFWQFARLTQDSQILIGQKMRFTDARTTAAKLGDSASLAAWRCRTFIRYPTIDGYVPLETCNLESEVRGNAVCSVKIECGNGIVI